MANGKGLLIDLDGTLYHGNRVIPGAADWIARLKQAGIPYLFVTNNSSRTPEGVAAHMQELGIEAEADQVCTSALAAAAYIAGEQPGASVYVIGEPGLVAAVQAAGLKVSEEQPDYVLQGIDRSFTYDKLTIALRLISGGARFVLTNPDLQLPSHDGLLPGAGTLGAAITAATTVEPVVIGKPSSILMEYALQRIGLSAEDAIVVGDNMLTDIAAGAAAGCPTILVMTGVTTEQNLSQHEAQTGVRADQVCQSLSEIDPARLDQLSRL
ncbi:TIGR01457 family HAD-type hydrolase [Paenibacillus hunanensis]|uniref:TIGR01457 family HAD-type hydrolase n=1 Tax=Paenibacillus hunanensis TaxID=539262 RepID=UPI002025FA19|nr:TIGR01457 family HAD-type hydrolase [Paenibacillus hunanensis]MCL9662324.1 TIGR01457 family HAD-type hydrolase [Paenibacillus hunanensis]